MLRKILRRHGVARTVTGMTVISVILSLGISWSIHVLLKDGLHRDDAIIAILAPLLIAPAMSIQMLRLLHRLDHAEQSLLVLSHTDELTQTYNRRYFVQYINQEFKRVQRSTETFSIAILDIDNFKEINDRWGHPAGDETLRAISSMFKTCIRESDICARYGGDEFIFLLPRTDQQQAERWVGRFYERFAASVILAGDRQIRPLFSMGIAVYDPSYDNFDRLLIEADGALYEAKYKGGNQFVIRCRPKTGETKPDFTGIEEKRSGG